MAEPATGKSSSPAVAMMTRMLKSSLAYAHAMWLVAVGICFWIDGQAGMANAAVGGGAVVFFYAAGQGIQMLAGELDPHSGMGLTVASFVTRAALLGLLWVGLSASEAAQAAFRPVSFFLSLLLVLAGWLLGMFLAWSRMRVPVYDADWDPRPLVRSAGMRRARKHARRPESDQRGDAR
ncbi:hypothetical protein [Aestuariimicrobium sp. Y1814]|uniref:hypothetical protein n=1 Tax=Aestuariimicrobium sp. Y1814 TaxID=3418742 RepID=UPI003DA70D1D